MSIRKVLLHKGGSPAKPRVFLLSYTTVAAININGTTINTALGINVGAKMFPLNDCQRATLRNRLSKERFIIADEIYLVSSAPFCLLHDRLNEIFGCSEEVAFSRIPVLLSGDF